MNDAKNASINLGDKNFYILERVRAHLSMMQIVQRIDKKNIEEKSKTSKTARKACKNLEDLVLRTSERKIKRRKRLKNALNRSLKQMNRFLDAKKKRQPVFLSRYLHSLAELKLSRFE